jgi:hypothetical protein
VALGHGVPCRRSARQPKPYRPWITLETTCEEIFQAGFLIERLLEPRPAPQARALDPGACDKLAREPTGFIAFRLVPRPG